MKKKKDKKESTPQSSWDVLEELDKEEREAELSENYGDDDADADDEADEVDETDETDEADEAPEGDTASDEEDAADEDAAEADDASDEAEETDADREPTEILTTESKPKVFRPEIDLSEKKPEEEDSDDEKKSGDKASVGKKIFGIFTILLMLGAFALAGLAFYFLRYAPSYVKNTNGDTLVYPELASTSDAKSVTRLTIVASVTDATFVPEIKKATEFDAVTEEATEAPAPSVEVVPEDDSSDDETYEDTTNYDDSSDDSEDETYEEEE